ncbi:MAG TPA: hypothetical protein VMJ90_10425 [Anaerolineales bacterium]|nr:hypothetical protein [Anaerolineales bacterium]
MDTSYWLFYNYFSLLAWLDPAPEVAFRARTRLEIEIRLQPVV